MGEYAHKRTIEYMAQNHSILTLHETGMIDQLRIIRNDISYEGKTVNKDYISRHINLFNTVIDKLSGSIKERISGKK